MLPDRADVDYWTYPLFRSPSSACAPRDELKKEPKGSGVFFGQPANGQGSLGPKKTPDPLRVNVHHDPRRAVRRRGHADPAHALSRRCLCGRGQSIRLAAGRSHGGDQISRGIRTAGSARSATARRQNERGPRAQALASDRGRGLSRSDRRRRRCSTSCGDTSRGPTRGPCSTTRPKPGRPSKRLASRWVWRRISTLGSCKSAKRSRRWRSAGTCSFLRSYPGASLARDSSPPSNEP